MVKQLRRMARFTVQRQWLEDWERLLVPLFEDVVVIDAKMRWDLDAIEYLAVSNRFPESDPNTNAPTWLVLPEFIDTGTSSGVMRLHLVGPHETLNDAIARRKEKLHSEMTSWERGRCH